MRKKIFLSRPFRENRPYTNRKTRSRGGSSCPDTRWLTLKGGGGGGVVNQGWGVGWTVELKLNRKKGKYSLDQLTVRDYYFSRHTKEHYRLNFNKKYRYPGEMNFKNWLVPAL